MQVKLFMLGYVGHMQTVLCRTVSTKKDLVVDGALMRVGVQ